MLSAPLPSGLALGAALLAAGLAGGDPEDAATAAPDFAREVKPILSRNCFACHGPDPEHREAGLRLDTFEGATALRDGVAAVVPGDLEASDLWHKLHDARRPMPPPDSGFELTDAERATLGRWIAAGAEYAPHWSFVPVERPAPPAVPAELRPDGGLHPIDAFVRARLAREGLHPAPEADRRTLARRVALDLVGLPPDPARVEAFVADERPDAYERLVDELLASPHYGEHWAAMWLDLARYADSKGYGSDPLRSIWRWRDWVIEAFDANMPFDRFTELQLAGDLLPDATWETRLATAFHRNTMVNTEGGTDDEEYRVAAVKDRANTTGQVWLGLTVGCAECHSHKFDPLTQEEYYSFYALFDQTADRDANDDSPRIETPTRAQAAALRDLDARRAALQAELDAAPAVDGAALAAWLGRQRDWALPRATPEALVCGSGARLPRSAEGAYDNREATPPATDTYTLELEPAAPPTAVLLRAEPRADLPNGGPGTSPGNGNFVVTEVRAFARPLTLELVAGRTVRVRHHGPDRILSLAEVEVFAGGVNVARGGDATQSSVAYAGPPALAVDGVTDGAHEHGSVTHTATEADPWWQVDLGAVHAIDRIVLWNRTDGALEERLRGASVQVLGSDGRVVWESHLDRAPDPSLVLVPVEGRRLRLEPASASFEQDGWTLAHALDGDPRTGWAIGPRVGEAHEAVLWLANAPAEPFALELELAQDYGEAHLLGRFAVRTSDGDEAPRALTQRQRAAVEAEPSTWSAGVRDELEALVRADDPARAAQLARLDALERERAALDVAETPVLVALPPGERRTTRVLQKGNFLAPGAEVAPGVPAALAGGAAVTDRLALARWLTARDNPLTARVHANRLWARLFGVGLVETEEDFGAQGTPPTHPRLLDWLAAELMESGWDQRHLLRTLVLSATYRQAATVSPEHLALDPDNRLLARGPRFRLSAETVRDQALAIAGLLSAKKLGPSVFPPQPDGLWQAAFNGADRTWEESTGEDRYRRALYVFLRRTSPYPSLQTFDAPTRETCTVRRIRTNTPLQAFVTLNDPVYVECAQALARRVVRAADPSDEGRAAYALRLALARPPSDAEVAALVELVASERAHFADRPGDARTLATEPLGPLDDGDDPVELAAWTVAANVVLNLDEVLTKP